MTVLSSISLFSIYAGFTWYNFQPNVVVAGEIAKCKIILM